MINRIRTVKEVKETRAALYEAVGKARPSDDVRFIELVVTLHGDGSVTVAERAYPMNENEA